MTVIPAAKIRAMGCQTLDGPTMNDSACGDAAFGPELGLDLEQVGRIEVVRARARRPTAAPPRWRWGTS